MFSHPLVDTIVPFVIVYMTAMIKSHPHTADTAAVLSSPDRRDALDSLALKLEGDCDRNVGLSDLVLLAIAVIGVAGYEHFSLISVPVTFTYSSST